MIRNADLLGFDHSEIMIIATLAYYQRKQRPKTKHKEIQTLDEGSQEIVKKLSVLLQLAESLDRSHAGVVNTVEFNNSSKKEITLKIDARNDCQLEVWGVYNQKKNFKKTFDKKLLIQTNLDQ
jgi:exopolyphosphatase/guanosine-5'-triphosphate,3'-diphosphate pyrophosphatase